MRGYTIYEGNRLQIIIPIVFDLATVQPKNNAHTRTSFCVRKPATSCGFLQVTCAWILQDARTSLRLEVKQQELLCGRILTRKNFFALTS